MALILSVNGYGEVENESMEITVNEAQEDIMTGDMKMNVDGTLLADAPLTVSITRSKSSLADEFCCGGQCKAGNGTTSETFNYTPSGITNWYAHYTPVAGSYETIIYRFDDGTDSKTLTVHYDYSTRSIGEIQKSTNGLRKIMKDGIVYIVKDNKKYTVL